jgi:hypothetical protein
MVDISTSPNYQCREPIMLIVGRLTNGRHPVRAFVFPHGRPRLEFQLDEASKEI